MNLVDQIRTYSIKKIEGTHSFNNKHLIEEIVNLAEDALQYQIKGLTNPLDNPFSFVDIIVLPSNTKIFVNGIIATTTLHELPLVLNPSTKRVLRFEYPSDSDEVVTAYTLRLDKKREIIYQETIRCGEGIVVSGSNVLIEQN